MKRKLPALLCALALILSLAGCVISTPDMVGTIGDVEITSGLYLLAQYNAYQSAANLASSDQDAANVKSFLKETITTDPDSGETATVSDYIADQTQKNLDLYAAVESRFDELGGQLTEAEESQADSYASQLMDQYADTYKANGIGLETLKRFERILLKSNDLLELVYGQNGAKAIQIETLGNPNSEVVDIERVAKIAHEAGIPLIVDNTFATPYLVRPIEYGADIVIHSATKFIGGHGTTIGGVIVDSGKFDWTQNNKWPWLVEPNVSYHGVSFAKDCAPAAFVTYIRAILLRDTGATLSPIHAFIFLQGLETLSLRVERHVSNALKVVEYLKNQPLVEKVNHPSVTDNEEQKELYKKYFPNGGGSIFTFEIKGDAKKAQEFIDNLELFSLLANVADVKSLAIHPASTTHSECNEAELLDQGIKPNTIRLSIGTENIADIIEDLDEAFKAIQ